MTPLDDVLARLDELARMMRGRAKNSPRPVDAQLYDVKAESYENAAGMVRRAMAAMANG